MKEEALKLADNLDKASEYLRCIGDADFKECADMIRKLVAENEEKDKGLEIQAKLLKKLVAELDKQEQCIQAFRAGRGSKSSLFIPSCPTCGIKKFFETDGCECTAKEASEQRKLDKQGEPVAWLYEVPCGASKLSFGKQDYIKGYCKEIPLYTAPQTKLSDEEIEGIYQSLQLEGYIRKQDCVDFARAIEERHGIK